MLEVFYADVSRLSRKDDDPVISDYRRNKLKSIRCEKVYRQSLGAELLLLSALPSVSPEIPLPPHIVNGAFGKPEIDGLCFNISHSGCMAACAISDKPVGIDLQKETRFNSALAKRFFTGGELAALLACTDRDAAFSRLWCYKESYLKMSGLGLSAPLNSFEIDVLDSQRAMVAGEPLCRLWYTKVGEYHLALCSHSEDIVSVHEVQLP